MKFHRSISKAILLFLFLFSLQPLPSSAQVDSPNLIINEFMADPGAVSDTKGEWIELFNPTTQTINLKGWKLSDAGSDQHTINSDLLIAPNAYLVLAKNGDTNLNGGIVADYVYTGLTLANTTDQIILTNSGGEVIDTVNYNKSAGWKIVGGASLELIDKNQPHNNFANWEISATNYGEGDFGTPGEFNSQGIIVETDTTTPISSANVNSGIYYAPQTVTLSAIEPEKNPAQCANCTIYYTLDGTTPTTSSSVYTQPIPIQIATTLKFFAVDPAGNFETSIHTNSYLIVYLNSTPFNFKGTSASGAVALTWDFVPNAQSYQIYRSTNLGKSYSYLGASTENFYLDATVLSGTNYKYRLVTVDAIGKIKVVSTTTLIKL